MKKQFTYARNTRFLRARQVKTSVWFCAARQLDQTRQNEAKRSEQMGRWHKKLLSLHTAIAAGSADSLQVFLRACAHTNETLTTTGTRLTKLESSLVRQQFPSHVLPSTANNIQSCCKEFWHTTPAIQIAFMFLMWTHTARITIHDLHTNSAGYIYIYVDYNVYHSGAWKSRAVRRTCIYYR